MDAARSDFHTIALILGHCKDLEGTVDADYARFVAEFCDLIRNRKPTQESRAFTALTHSNKEVSFSKVRHLGRYL